MAEYEKNEEAGAVYQVEVDAAEVSGAESALVAILIRQNRLFQGAVDSVPVVNQRNLWWAVRILAPIAAALGLVIVYSTLRCGGSAFPAQWVLLVCALCVLSWLAWRLPCDWLNPRRFAEGIVRRRMRKVIERTLRMTPFKATYRAGLDVLEIEIDNPRLKKCVPMNRIATAAFCGSLCCLFRRRLSQRWAGIVYLGSAEQEQGLRELLLRHSIDVLELGEEQDSETLACNPAAS